MSVGAGSLAVGRARPIRPAKLTPRGERERPKVCGNVRSDIWRVSWAICPVIVEPM